ncbi:MAG: NAD(P)H-binding protein [Cyanobacteria bacterium CRU_2_1]|nr:NAD(P)H-binding protein [Cyanobacteria bacterium RU_5_0]NJR62463.1 NAD(P)H-binding protein [Cyanobacteria bacterium CRU_2_1]
MGRCLAEQALVQDHHVTAAVRNPATVHITHERLRVLPCDVLNAASVNQALTGQDVVFCTLGTNSKGPITLYSAGAHNILQGMQAHQVRRLIFLSNFGVLDEKARDVRGAALLFLIKRFIPHTLADHRRALEEIRGHAPEWIVVRPLPLTDGSWTGRYRIAVDDLPAKGMHIARADVADFMMRQATSDDYLYKVPAIAY